MNTQQAYINGFVKRASEYGYSEAQAVELLKQAGPGAMAGGASNIAPHINETGAALSTPAKGPSKPGWNKGIETMPENIKKQLNLPTVKAGAEQVPYTGVKTLGEMWNEFKSKAPTMVTKTPVSKGTPQINPMLAAK